MVRPVVRFFLGSQGEGLTQQDHTHQQEHQQCSHGTRTAAGRLGEAAATKQGHTGTVVARSYALRLAETPGPRHAELAGADRPHRSIPMEYRNTAYDFW